ncbi:hypothetical protein BH18GEM1_BH18GEM1_05020 [soil metagenome]
MMRGASSGRFVLLIVALGCASNPARTERPDGDRTEEPEFVAAREAAEPEFETQADALAAGAYEPFVHPDSLPQPAPGKPGQGPRREDLTTPRVAGDPSTEELLGTLERPDSYNPLSRGASPVGPSTAVSGESAGAWTLQIGAFGTEAGALVRIRQLERDFPDLSAWSVRGEVHRVFLGRFTNRAAAERARAVVASGGYPDAWITSADP